MTSDVGDERQVRVNFTKAQLARNQELEDLRAILETYGGRAYIWRILVNCGVKGDNVLGFDAENMYWTSFHAGKRDLGIALEKEVFTTDQEAYTMMHKEAVSRDTSRTRKED